MALTLTTNASASGGLSTSLAITIGAGADRCIFVSALIQSTRTIASVLCGGVAMVLVDSVPVGASTGRTWYIFKLDNPNTGATNVVVTLNTAPSVGYDSHVFGAVYEGCAGLRQEYMQGASTQANPTAITYSLPLPLLTTSKLLVQTLAIGYGASNVDVQIPTGTAATNIKNSTLPAIGQNNVETNAVALNTNDGVYIFTPTAPAYVAFIVFEVEEVVPATTTTTTTAGPTTTTTTTSTTTIAPGTRRRFLISS